MDTWFGRAAVKAHAGKGGIGNRRDRTKETSNISNRGRLTETRDGTNEVWLRGSLELEVVPSSPSGEVFKFQGY